MSAVDTQREADKAQIKQQVTRIAEGTRAKDLEGPSADIRDRRRVLRRRAAAAACRGRSEAEELGERLCGLPDADYEVRGLSVAADDEVAFGHCFGRLHGTLMNGGDQRHLGPGHVLLPEARRRLADRARPGFGAVRRAQRPRSGRPRTLTVLSSPSAVTRASSPGPVRGPMVQIR
jgi:hypothetical protein